jgi:hypothetical protein
VNAREFDEAALVGHVSHICILGAAGVAKAVEEAGTGIPRSGTIAASAAEKIKRGIRFPNE